MFALKYFKNLILSFEPLKNVSFKFNPFEVLIRIAFDVKQGVMITFWWGYFNLFKYFYQALYFYHLKISIYTDRKYGIKGKLRRKIFDSTAPFTYIYCPCQQCEPKYVRHYHSQESILPAYTVDHKRNRNSGKSSTKWHAPCKPWQLTFCQLDSSFSSGQLRTGLTCPPKQRTDW